MFNLQQHAVRLICLLFLSWVSLYAQKPQVLFLSSYHGSFQIFYDQLDGIRDVFGGRVLLDVEHLDSKRHPEQENTRRFTEYLGFKMATRRPYDVVITGDDNALHFALAQQHHLFAGSPIVFLGVNNAKLALEQNNNPGVTGIIEALTVKETLQSIHRLQPDVKTVYGITDSTTTGLANLELFYNQKDSIPELELKHLSLADYTFESYYERLSQLPPDSALIWLSSFVDKAGDSRPLDAIAEGMLKASPVPIYHLHNFEMGYGIIGGHLISHYEGGRRAAIMANQILNGMSPADLPVQQESPNLYIFDYAVLQRFGIATGRLPENTQLINPPEKFLETHSRLIWLLLSISGVLLLSLLGIMAYRVRKRQLYIEKMESLLQRSQGIGKIGSFEYDPKNDVYTRSDEMVRILDLQDQPDANVGNLYQLLEQIHEEDREAIRRVIQEALQSNKGYSTRYRVKGKNGLIFIEENAQVIEAHPNRNILIGNALDVTDKARLMEEKKAQEALLMQQSKLAAMGEMISAIAHQWRQPLNTVACALMNVQDELDSDKLQGTFLESEIHKINQTLDYMSQTIDDFRNFFKPDTTVREFDLCQTVIASLKLTMASLVRHFVLYRIILPDGKVITDFTQTSTCKIIVEGYQNKLVQALINIIHNAIDAISQNETVKESSEGLIEITITAENKDINIIIEDNGGGIDQEILPRIFEPYFTTKEDSSGTGIGLYMVKMLVEQNMDGTIKAENGAKGARFTITLHKSTKR